MKRVLTILLLLVTVAAVTGCEPTKAPAKGAEQPKPNSTARSIEEIKAKLQEVQNNIDKTESLLIKRIAQRDTAKSELNQLFRRADKTPKEIKAELVKGKSDLDSQIWFQEIRVAWNDLKDVGRDVEIFTRQEERLKATKIKLEQTLKELKRIEENNRVYVPGVDPELDRRLAKGEVIEQDSDWDKLTSGEQAEIDIKVDKLMDETIENNVSKIPGLELKSIEELPALPDIAAMVTTPDSPVQKSLMGRVKNDCNKIVEKVQKEVDEYLKEKQPEAACSCWLEAIKRIVEKVNSASEQFSADTFMDYLNELETCQKDTLRILCKPYLQTFAQCVKDLESKDPDWDAIAESLEGLLRIRPTLIKSEVEALIEQIEIVHLHLKYSLNQKDRDSNVKSQRVETVFERVNFVYFKEYRRLEAEKKAKEEAARKAEAEKKAKEEAARKAEAEKKAKESALKAEAEEAWKHVLSIPGIKAGERRTVTVNGVEFAFRWCPPGSFMMGSPNDEKYRDSDEKQHKVTLTKGFWMMETEVTQKQWKAVMGDNPSYFKGDNLPVECVSWNDCQKFCWKIGLQLPTEAQWEYACRAGSLGAYAGNLDDMAWYSSNSGSKTHPVGMKKANAWGLYDMHGNVWEWCQDRKGDYPSGSVTDPTGPSSGFLRVDRGGGWFSNAGNSGNCRSASRGNRGPGDRDDGLGFRVVRVTKTTPNKTLSIILDVEGTITEARQLLTNNPAKVEQAIVSLKKQRDQVLRNSIISASERDELVRKLQGAIIEAQEFGDKLVRKHQDQALKKAIEQDRVQRRKESEKKRIIDPADPFGDYDDDSLENDPADPFGDYDDDSLENDPLLI